MKGISRIESKKFTGYTARIYRGGKTITASFSDSTYGCQEKAFEAAKSYIENISKEIPVIHKNKTFGISFKTKNTDLPAGVTKGADPQLIGVLPFYRVTWSHPKNVRHVKKFYYQQGNDASEQEARRNAIMFREQREDEILEG